MVSVLEEAGRATFAGYQESVSVMRKRRVTGCHTW